MLGALVEKELTTPQGYPLTDNALLAACNQTSNRDPIAHYDEGTVLQAIDGLKARKMARIVHPSTGSRSTKYRHVLDEALVLEGPELSVLCVLLLRGPQTAAELRARTERLHPFAGLDDVEATLEALASRDEPLARRHERRPGEREPRWSQLVAVEEEQTAVATAPRTRDEHGLSERVTALEAEVAELRSVVDRLKPLLD